LPKASTRNLVSPNPVIKPTVLRLLVNKPDVYARTVRTATILRLPKKTRIPPIVNPLDPLAMVAIAMAAVLPAAIPPTVYVNVLNEIAINPSARQATATEMSVLRYGTWPDRDVIVDR
jgi:hypothetical protein